MLSNTQEFWTQNWDRHFDEYINYAPLQAFYLYFFLWKTDIKVLEIAAGSFHDTFCLNQWGISCTGIDLCFKAVQMARRSNPQFRHKTFVMNAKNIGFEDKSFDVSFHNGFFVNFDNDQEIHQLLKEQTRVTREMIVCSVHNGLNANLVKKFEFLSQYDDLYNIRFYTPQKLKELLMTHCRKVIIFPFNIPELDERIAISEGRDKDLLKTRYFQNYSMSNVQKCKRLMGIGYL